MAGIVGLVVFLVLHSIWIVPIWFVAPVGAVVAATAGAAVGAAYGELLPHMPRPPWSAPAFFVAIGLVLLPAVAFAELRGPMHAMDADGGGSLLAPGIEVVADVVAGLLVSATLSGAAVGWLIARRRRAAGLTALAGLALALGPGHNIPFLGGTSSVGTELAILAAVGVAATLVLVACHAWLSSRRPSSPGALPHVSSDRPLAKGPEGG